MTEQRPKQPALRPGVGDVQPVKPDEIAGYVPYDKRQLSYANTFRSPLKANTIRAMEWGSGKITLLRLIRRFERMGVPSGQAFWPQALDVMGIRLETPVEQIARIPATGPVILVANHPHGLVDGMVLAELVGRVRTDYKILARSLLTGVDEIADFMLPVPFPHEDDSLGQSLEMRRAAMAHLERGGVIILFPSGVVASSDTMFGPVIEREWNPFTAKMILRSGASVVPVRFKGQNSRLYQVANQISATFRQGLLIHEVVKSLNRPQAPVVGEAISPEELRLWRSNPRGLVAHLRDLTLSLA